MLFHEKKKTSIIENNFKIIIQDYGKFKKKLENSYKNCNIRY